MNKELCYVAYWEVRGKMVRAKPWLRSFCIVKEEDPILPQILDAIKQAWNWKDIDKVEIVQKEDDYIYLHIQEKSGASVFFLENGKSKIYTGFDGEKKIPKGFVREALKTEVKEWGNK